MTHPLSTLQPTIVWDYFYQLTQIPRPSHHEEKIQAFILNFGKSLGLESSKDAVGNIIIKKPATPGYEHCKGVILQSHLDMVPQANSDSHHDFVNDPITAYIDEDGDDAGKWVTADATTLGADNGIGVAAMMAVLASNDIEHGPIEALFTSTEETGMVGAINLQPDVLDGEILLNLDSEDERLLFIGCAGGIDATATLDIHREPLTPDYDIIQINIQGLRGGHSGVDIIKQRANSNKLLARLLKNISYQCDYQLVDFTGGNLRNAIPREAQAIIAISKNHSTIINECIAAMSEHIAREYHTIERNFTITTKHIEQALLPQTNALVASDAKALLNLINAYPNGVARMSVDMDNLVETSSNLAIVTTTENEIIVECLLRSSLDSARDELAEQVNSIFQLAGATCEFSGSYPGWQPNPNSDILKVMLQTGEELFGTKPELFGIHAGLECGILGGIYPNWDMISFGPTIRAPHSPDEKVEIATVKDFYNWLLATLKAIPHKA